MEPSPTAHRVSAPLDASLGVGRMLSRLTLFFARRGPSVAANRGAVSRARRRPLAEANAPAAWHSYAVYSGALSLRHHKSSRRTP
jgi:hypothetical protein